MLRNLDLTFVWINGKKQTKLQRNKNEIPLVPSCIYVDIHF